jgi:O-antigen/teichoic acid export membrane protein
VQMAARMGGDAIFYSAVMGAVFPLALLNALIFTHYMTTTQYGQLAILFVVAGLGTAILNLFFLRGTEGQVWGTTDEGATVDISELAAGNERAWVLGTGLMMSIVSAVLLVAAVVPFAPAISRLLVHTPRLSAAVIWTAVSAALGCVWRLVVNIGRWERRRKGFGLVWVLRPGLAVAIGWPLVAAGYGVAGAVAATAIGTFISTALAFIIWRGSYRLTLDRRSARKIASRSGKFAAMVIGLFILHSGDVFILSRYASSSQVGVYRLATNITSVVSYTVSAFLMAWSPLEFTALFRAAYERHGHRALRAEFTHYYLIVGALMVLVLTALATPIMSLFASSYRAAGGFVAITGLGYIGYGLLMTLARSTKFPHRYAIYGMAALGAAGGLIVTSLFLGGPLGGYGVAIGDSVGALVGITVILVTGALFGELPEVDLRRMGTLALLGVGCWWLGGPFAADTGLNLALKAGSVALFVVGIFVTGVIPASHRRVLLDTARGLFRRSSGPPDPALRIAELSPVDREIVEELVCQRQSPARVGAALSMSADMVRSRLVGALRQLAGDGTDTGNDVAIAEYLLWEGSITERDVMSATLGRQGVDPVDFHSIEATFDALRRTPRRRGRLRTSSRRVGQRDRASQIRSWSLTEPSLNLLDQVIRRRRASLDVARELGIERDEVHRRLMHSLRVLAGDREAAGGSPHVGDALIGASLFGGDERPPAAQLWAAGLDPLEVHRLELTVAAVGEMPRRRWLRLRATARGNGAQINGAEITGAQINDAQIEPVTGIVAD